MPSPARGEARSPADPAPAYCTVATLPAPVLTTAFAGGVTMVVKLGSPGTAGNACGRRCVDALRADGPDRGGRGVAADERSVQCRGGGREHAHQRGGADHRGDVRLRLVQPRWTHARRAQAEWAHARSAGRSQQVRSARRRLAEAHGVARFVSIALMARARPHRESPARPAGIPPLGINLRHGFDQDHVNVEPVRRRTRSNRRAAVRRRSRRCTGASPIRRPPVGQSPSRCAGS